MFLYGAIVTTITAVGATARVGDGWGTNIHWMVPPGGAAEAAMLGQAYRVARMDFKWHLIETTKGQYDFDKYDDLLATMRGIGVRPYWILDYGNPLYPPVPVHDPHNCTTRENCNATCPTIAGNPMRTCKADGTYYCCGAPSCRGVHLCPGNPNLRSCACDDNPGHPSGNPGCNSAGCIAAFGAFAQAAAARFAGNGVIWECLNEPNGMGNDAPADIAALCKSAGAPFKARGELFVGPALAGMGKTSMLYLDTAMANGLLDALGAVSVHPYRGSAPETVLGDWSGAWGDYPELKAMIKLHGKTPAQQSMAVMSGEWGYTTAGGGCVYPNRCDELTQAAYLARMWLVNTAAGVEVSINYDWSDGSGNASDCESNFGSVHPIVAGEPIQPKPKYTAALTLQTVIGDFSAGGYHVEPVSVGPAPVSPADVFVLRFENSTAAAAVNGVRASARTKTTRTPSAVGFAVWTNGSWTQGQCADNGTSSAPPPERKDCGYRGIGRADCLAATNPKGPGCCWEPCKTPGACPTIPAGPMCYRIQRPLVGIAQVKFAVSPAPPSQCFTVTGMLGDRFPAVCAAGGVVTVSVPTNGTASGPIYLVSSQ